MSKVFMVFLRFSNQMNGKYVKLGDGCFSIPFTIYYLLITVLFFKSGVTYSSHWVLSD
jgi:hypothetical protein